MSSTALSATTGTAASATPSSTSVCTSNLYDTPIQDRVCAMPYGGNHTDIMSNCCKDADVVAYYDNCGLYCLALDQSIKDLQDCLFEQGAGYTDVFCRDNGNVNASATATGNAQPPSSAQASVVASGGAGTGDGDGDGNSASGSGGSASSTSSPNAAAGGLHAPAGVSTLGLTIGALLLSAATFGALQI
ncbi:hypothetical protein ColTof4_07304 [Colletotrichum tofieldiae]|uniref:Uncharacterized protein n=1 Tax=Colletotrichum tofieldiae TaxID=708197 RepID=A0A166SV77_9PEZI|nr:hypothetical protein CT0861_11672 [Colletotrichum tofieldiae]GKT64907.1 hypothetical protein ColTof3_12246 [Colletotrichum tofieldiae]GKT74881.1 hypothetical protein ColTof4_07304 [Colletotrichum tofieldiae]GKT92086.1 hypothetical protein Ct61P_09936 [Colletotrichum tofieldiae]